MSTATTTPHTPWPTVKLGDVCEEIRERILTDVISLETYITTDNMLKSCGGVRVADSLPPNTSLVRYKIGDVLLSNIRPYLKKLWCATCDGGCSSDVIVFRSLRGDLDSNYLYQVLSQEAFFDYVMQNVSGTKMPRGKREWIKDFTFPLPPLEVQREIVAKVEAGLKEADALVAHFKRLAALADETFKAELDETFSTLNAPTVTLGDVCVTTSGGTPLRTRREYYENGNIPWLRSGEVCQKDITQTEMFITQQGVENSSAKLIPVNSVVVAMYGATAGQVGILRIESTTNQAVCGVLPSNKYVPEFLYYQLLSMKKVMVSQAQGGAQPNISQIKIKNLQIYFPSLDIQREIVGKLEAVKARCERLKAEAERGLKAAEALRKAVLAEAFEQ